jgi:hypothetical protein
MIRSLPMPKRLGRSLQFTVVFSSPNRSSMSKTMARLGSNPTTLVPHSNRPSTLAERPAVGQSMSARASIRPVKLHLRSGVRLYIEAGATLFASLDGTQFDAPPKAALISGEDLREIAIEGRGTLDGQSSYGVRTISPTTTPFQINAGWKPPASL